jgi:hypothetical protein
MNKQMMGRPRYPAGRRRRSHAAAALLAAVALLATGCGREERTLSVMGSATVAREGLAGETVRLEGRISDTQLGPEFSDAWAAVTRGATPYPALMLTVTDAWDGAADRSDLVMGLVLAVPTPLRPGAVYPIGGAFAPPSGMPMYWRAWGRRDVAVPGVAEVALRTFDYRRVGMRVENDFVAAAASGAVQVVSAGREQVVLRIDIVATDAAGRRVVLQGELDIRPERYTPPIT